LFNYLSWVGDDIIDEMTNAQEIEHVLHNDGVVVGDDENDAREVLSGHSKQVLHARSQRLGQLGPGRIKHSFSH
jgi:hypothetical protein